MTFEEALEARLLSAPALVQLVGARIGWERRLDALPALTLQVVSDPRPQHFKGRQRVRPTDIQIDVWAATAQQAAAIRDIVITVLLPASKGNVRFQRGMVTDVRGGAEAQDGTTLQRLRGEIQRQSIDLTLTHNAN